MKHWDGFNVLRREFIYLSVTVLLFTEYSHCWKYMNDKNDIEMFKCHYTDAPRFDRIFVWSLGIGMMVVLILIPAKGNIYPSLIFGLIYILMPFWFEYTVRMRRTKGYIQLIDNNIVYKAWMSRKVSYPIDKIKSVKVVDFDADVVDKLTQDYQLPVSMGKVNLYPRKGVIVFFDRKWIKSVRPILFNPIDPEQFAHTLIEKSCNTSSSESRWKRSSIIWRILLLAFSRIHRYAPLASGKIHSNASAPNYTTRKFLGRSLCKAICGIKWVKPKLRCIC